MFVIKVNGQAHLWLNSESDDFLRFLPDHFGVPADQIEVQKLESKEKAREIMEFLSEGGDRSIQLSGNKVEKIKHIPEKREPPLFKVGDPDPDDPAKTLKANDARTKEKVTPAKNEKQGEELLKSLKKWPYDDQGNFLGNEFQA